MNEESMWSLTRTPSWNLINSAPTDNTAILGYQKITDDLFVVAPMYYKDGKWLLIAFHGDNTEYEMYPTHWMHSPEPPE